MNTTVGANIATALVAFQEHMPKVHKGKTATVPTKAGGSYRYNYADLADVTAAAAPALVKHGLAFISCPQRTDKGYELVGTLVHDSGETITGSLPLHGGTEQAMGSSLTYARRYLLGCLTGIVTDDDEDGALASQTPRQPQQERAQDGPTQQELAERVLAGLQDATTEDEVREWGNRAHARNLLDVPTTDHRGRGPMTVRECVQERLAELGGGAAA
jgi:hypothetical protein